MEIKPIRNDADHEAPLHCIEEFWGAPPESAEGDGLDVLATLAEAYERECYPY